MLPLFAQTAELLSVPSPSVADTKSMVAGMTSVITRSSACAEPSPSLLTVIVYVTRELSTTSDDGVVLVTARLDGPTADARGVAGTV